VPGKVRREKSQLMKNRIVMRILWSTKESLVKRSCMIPMNIVGLSKIIGFQGIKLGEGIIKSCEISFCGENFGVGIFGLFGGPCLVKTL